ncbi:MAG: hypothetical protein GY765_36600 [bacterium]|nr:hypothetical protein [bacterium]
MELKKILLFILLTGFVFSLSAGEIHQTAQTGDLEKVKTLLQKDPGLLNAEDNRKTTPLHFAASSGHKEVTQYLLSKGARTDIGDVDGDTPLHWTADGGKVETAKLLLDGGAALESKNKNGYTPLYWAVTRRHKKMVNLLVDTFYRSKPTGRIETAGISIHDAAGCGNKKLLTLMVANGVDKKTKNKYGGSFLHSVAAGGFENFTDIMLTKGLKPNARNDYGETPLLLAAEAGHLGVVRLLVKKGAKINLNGGDGSTALSRAEKNKHADIAAFLISKGADKKKGLPAPLKGPYMGQTPPGKKKKIFALGTVSEKDTVTFAGTFSPDLKEYFYTWRKPGFMQGVKYMRMVNGVWSKPRAAPFSYDCFEFEPHITPDGKRLFYGSNRPLPGKTAVSRRNHIWYVDKTKTGWSEPHLFGGDMMYVSVDSEGTIYYTGIPADRDPAKSGILIRKLDKKTGKYLPPEKLGPAVNYIRAAHPFIAPDGSYLIVDGRTPSKPDSNFYICFKKPDGTWTKAVNMGELINTDGGEMAASVSPDGKYLFVSSYLNEGCNIDWIDASVIDDLRNSQK